LKLNTFFFLLQNYPERVIVCVMEKKRSHYDLASIIDQMTSVEAMNLTLSAVEGIRQAGMLKSEALQVVCGLSNANFYKSMTTHKDHKVWQDVYHADWMGKQLYVKFQKAGEYFVVSFKER
jgi:motility quorum-sensing regulator / GCU-specific mRNA interferase toxin